MSDYRVPDLGTAKPAHRTFSLAGLGCCFSLSLRAHPCRNCSMTTITELHNILKGNGTPQTTNVVDEVYPRVFIGDETIVSNTLGLKLLKVTHVLNCAYGRGHRHVNTSDRTYAKKGIIFMGVPADDVPAFNLLPFFQETSDFIHNAISTNSGNVLVHCKVGLSRSPAIVIAYLMIHQQMTLKGAVGLVHGKRWQIWPNDGFLLQLICLEEELKKGAAMSGSFSIVRRRSAQLGQGSKAYPRERV